MENQVKVIGCMDHTLDNTFESANRVYDTDGICPTLSTMSGGGIQPKMIECKKVPVNELGFIDNGTGKHQSNTVFGTDGIAPTITTILNGGTQQIKIVDQQIVAMRGRNPENPSDRSKGIELEQRLEPNEQGICNTLTSVQKDNLVLETQYWAYDEQNKNLRNETFGTLTTDGSSPKHNNRVVESKKIKIRQATKEGFIDCEVGGGVGFGLSNIRNSKGPCDRKGQNLSDSNNGKYP